MLVAVFSDTHDDLAITATSVELASELGAEALIHCGDLASSEVVAICSRLSPFYFVFGNHDSDAVPDLLQAAEDYNATCLEWGGCIELAGKRIAVAHGHMTADIKPLLAERPDYLLTGHTHETANWTEGRVRRICPGALYRADSLTFALLGLESGEVEFVSMSD